MKLNIKRSLHIKNITRFSNRNWKNLPKLLNTHDVWGYDICKELHKMQKKKKNLGKISSRFKVSSLENIEHKKKFDNIISSKEH